jgi:hypothetical protein
MTTTRPSQAKLPRSTLLRDPCNQERPVCQNGPSPHLPKNSQMRRYPNALVPFALTPSYPLPSRVTHHTKPHPSPTAHSQSAPSASEGISIPYLSCSAWPNVPGMINSTHSSNISTKRYASKSQDSSYAACGNETTDATRNMRALTLAQDAEPSRMEPARVLELRRLQPRTPYRADAWETALNRTGLINFFPNILSGLREGFCVGYPTPFRVQTPPNSTSLSVYEHEFKDIVNKELDKGRYIGPLTFSTIEAFLGPYQSSPLSLIPKSGKPGKFRLIQNFSFPIETSFRFLSASVNSAITSEFFPCTWGKFSTIYLLILCLPTGSQVAMRDVAEAYRTVPLHELQWPAAVVRISETTACIDTCIAFGASPSCGAYGLIADAGAEILRANGIGPLDKWVDDHLFFRIPRLHLKQYNIARRQWDADIMHTGPRHTASRIWYSGVEHPNGSTEEFSESCIFPICDLSNNSPQSEDDAVFTYNFADIDEIS